LATAKRASSRSTPPPNSASHGYAGDGLRRAIEGGDPAGGVDGDQSRADRLEDQIAEGLKVRELPALLLEAALDAVIALGERARKRGDGEKHRPIDGHGERFESGRLRGLGQTQQGEELAAEHDVDIEKAGQAGRNEGAAQAEEEASLQHREDIQESENRTQAAARRDDAGGEGHVQADLHPREAPELDAPGSAHQEQA